MIANIEEVIDYIKCPMLYRQRHIEQIDTTYTGLKNAYPKYNESNMFENFERESRKLAYHIFNYIQDGRYPSIYLLRQKWSQIWCKDKTKEDLMFESTTTGMNIRKRLEKQGVQAIDYMHPKFKADPGLPIVVGKRIQLDLGRHKLSVTIDLIREVERQGKDILEMMVFKTGLESRTINKSMTTPSNLHIRNDVLTTAASLAFRQMVGQVEDQIVYYDMINDKEYRTRRTDKDRDALLSIVDNVERGIKAEIFYPVLDQRCISCPFEAKCKQRDWYAKKGG